MRVKALTKIYYGRREYQAGETYDMDDREQGEANILATLGKIEVLKEDKRARPQRYRTAEVKAEEAPPPAAEPAPTTAVQPMTTENADALAGGKRRYLRRDLKAEQ